jgi:hypothetical protein
MLSYAVFMPDSRRVSVATWKRGRIVGGIIV